MNYPETLNYLYTRLPMFSRIGVAAYKADLDNTIQLCNQLGEPQSSLKFIHVAGTNGKGSVSHMLAAILQSAGYRTGLYTSPHLKDFRERIRIDGEMIEESFIVDFTERIQPFLDEIDPSFFEITVAMALDYFAKNKVDIAIMETGLGGRLDSTNIIRPEVSVITNIGWDHMNLLGDTLPKIAAEKAGIIKENVPVVIGESLPETAPVFEEKARLMNAPLYLASKTRQAVGWSWHNQELTVEVAEQHKTDHHLYTLDLPGIYQTRNLLTVLETCSQLEQRGWNLPDGGIRNALRQVKKLTGLHGRWELIHQHPSVVLDVGHNQEGIRQVVEQLEVTDFHELHIVLGMVKDKEVEQLLTLFPKDARYYFTQAQIPRALEAATLAAKGLGAGLTGKTYADVNLALKEAFSKAQPNDLILVCGSVFLVGEVLL